MNVDREIAIQLYIAIEKLTDDIELLSIVGSYKDTLPDEDILMFLEEWNAGRPQIYACN